MSLMVGPMFWICGGVFSFIVAFNATGIEWVGWLGAVVGAVVFGLGHWYSPIPNHNGGFGMPPARMQKWGFNSEPRYDDYEVVTTEDVLSAAVPTGWSFAKRKDGGGD